MRKRKWQHTQRLANRERSLVVEAVHVIHGVGLVFLPGCQLGPDLAIEHIENVFERWLQTKDSPLARQ